MSLIIACTLFPLNVTYPYCSPLKTTVDRSLRQFSLIPSLQILPHSQLICKSPRGFLVQSVIRVYEAMRVCCNKPLNESVCFGLFQFTPDRALAPPLQNHQQSCSHMEIQTIIKSSANCEKERECDYM